MLLSALDDRELDMEAGMADLGDQLGSLVALAERCGVALRFEQLDGEGGGLCRVKGRDVLFVDASADTATQLDQSARALANHPAIERCFVRPDLRALLDRYRQDSSDTGRAVAE